MIQGTLSAMKGVDLTAFHLPALSSLLRKVWPQLKSHGDSIGPSQWSTRQSTYRDFLGWAFLAPWDHTIQLRGWSYMHHSDWFLTKRGNYGWKKGRILWKVTSQGNLITIPSWAGHHSHAPGLQFRTTSLVKHFEPALSIVLFFF